MLKFRRTMNVKWVFFLLLLLSFSMYTLMQIGGDGVNEEINSASVSAVECFLSRHAERINLIHLMSGLCRRYCVATSKPLFCDRRKFLEVHGKPRFDFSRKPMSHDQGIVTHVDAVYCALGVFFYGEGGQSYVFDSIRQWRIFHSPDISRVFLIVDDNRASDPRVKTLVEELSITLVHRSDVDTDQLARYRNVFYIQGYMHPGGNRTEGNTQFNQLVTERFFVVASVMRKFNLRHIIHMENDNMIYTDMRPVVGAIARCGYEIATTVPFIYGFIPGVVYIKDAASVERFCDFVNDLLSCGKSFGVKLGQKVTKKRDPYANDMTYLMRYYQLFGTSRIGELPSRMHAKGENCIVESSNEMGLSPYIFDAASFGQWYSFATLYGTPLPPIRIREAIKKRFMDITPPPPLVYVEENGRKIPMWKGLRLLSLHIHAKNLRSFSSL